MLGMRKYRIYTIRRQGDRFRTISIRMDRDPVTGEPSVYLSGFGHMLMISLVMTVREESLLPGRSMAVKGKYPVLVNCVLTRFGSW